MARESTAGQTKKTGRYMDDLWLYEVREHRWKCLWPGTDVSGKGIQVNDDGFEAGADGRPQPIAAIGHGYAPCGLLARRLRVLLHACPAGYETPAALAEKAVRGKNPTKRMLARGRFCSMTPSGCGSEQKQSVRQVVSATRGLRADAKTIIVP